jgi:hypothetical protein
MNKRVQIASDWSLFRGMTGIVISMRLTQRLVLLDGIPQHPMVFDLRELIWL